MGDWRGILGMREIFGKLGHDQGFVRSVKAGFSALDAGLLEPISA